jgi:uncharacterized protein (TIGR03083 family)
MFDAATARALAIRELEVIGDLTAELDDGAWAAPTRCAGWTVADVCAHAGLAATQQAEAFRRAADGNLEPPDYPGAPILAPAQIRELLASGTQSLDTALADLPAESLEGLTPMPFAVVPTAVALQVTVYEYAFHADDVRTAVSAPGAMPAEIAAAFFGFLPGLAPMMAGAAAPGEPTTGYRLVTPSATVNLAPGAHGWEIADRPPQRCCTVAGTDDAVALFVMGRLGADSPRLAITGDTDAAGSFKRWFPGP